MRVTELQLVTQVFVVVLASLCTLYLYACQESCHRRLRSLLLCLRVYVPCIYMHARRVAVGAHVFVVVLASLCTLYLHACQESYCRRLRSWLLRLCEVSRVLINSLVC